MQPSQPRATAGRTRRWASTAAGACTPISSPHWSRSCDPERRPAAREARNVARERLLAAGTLPPTRASWLTEGLPVRLRCEAHQELAAAIEHRPLDHRGLRQHQRERLLLVEPVLVLVGELAEGRSRNLISAPIRLRRPGKSDLLVKPVMSGLIGVQFCVAVRCCPYTEPPRIW